MKRAAPRSLSERVICTCLHQSPISLVGSRGPAGVERTHCNSGSAAGRLMVAEGIRDDRLDTHFLRWETPCTHLCFILLHRPTTKNPRSSFLYNCSLVHHVICWALDLELTPSVFPVNALWNISQVPPPSPPPIYDHTKARDDKKYLIIFISLS